MKRQECISWITYGDYYTFQENRHNNKSANESIIEKEEEVKEEERAKNNRHKKVISKLWKSDTTISSQIEMF